MSADAQRTVLIVEDSLDDRIILRRLLQPYAETHRVVEVSTGAEGLDVCGLEPPDCVLLDYHLTDMTGSRFLEVLKERAEGALPIPVALLTGLEDSLVAADVLARGAQDYLVKEALTGHALVRAIENAIERFQNQKELEEKSAALELRTFELEALRDELQANLMELAEATRAKDQFLAVMSHEMRTPLNAIIGYTDLMDLGIGGDLPEGQRVHMERIRVGGRHLLDLINDVLDLARADARKLEVDVRAVDARAVLEEVGALMESQAEAKGVQVVLDPLPEGFPHVRADLRRIRQILTNLIGNAIKFTESGSVTVRCEPSGDGMVRIHVVDTGIGIHPDVLPLVFTEFYQAEGTLTRQRGGTGLGLAISQKLARLMGGDIHAVSRPGEGSTFTLVLPAAPEGSVLRDEDVLAHASRMKAHHAPEPRPPGGPVVVAFGDDARSLADLQRRVLPRVRLVWTTNPDVVPTLAHDQGASLVVLDITCADGAAWRAAHALQENPQLASTPVLLLPRLPQVHADADSGGLDLGWVALVPKPFTQQQLAHAVQSAAENTAVARYDVAPIEVLVVDDDPDSRRVATNFLQAEGARVREAVDGETALVAMRRKAPDVVVLDLMMPVLDGFGVLAAMRADPLLSTIPVVVLTAKSLSDTERRFLARTTVRVLEKGEYRFADVAALVLRAAGTAGRVPEEEEPLAG